MIGPAITNHSFMSDTEYYSLMNLYELDPNDTDDEDTFNSFIVDLDSEAYGDIIANIPKKYAKYLEDETWLVLKRRYITFRLYEKVNQEDYTTQQLEQYRTTLDNARLNAIEEYGDSLKNESGKRTGMFVYNSTPTVVKR